jgi:hypothetical protein
VKLPAFGMSSRQKLFIAIAPVAVLATIFVLAGFLGANFGRHWDEPIQRVLLNNSIQSGYWYPRNWYFYPSAVYDLSLLANAPFILLHHSSHAVVTSALYFVHTRHYFIVATALGGFGLYYAARTFFGQFAGVVAAGVYWLSWELSYHSRWIAPDALLCSVTAIFLGVAAWSWKSNYRWAVLVPALVAGIGAGTKYQGAILLLPALLLAVAKLENGPSQWRFAIGRSFSAVGTFIVGFLLTTPGALVQPRLMLHQIGLMNRQYHSLTGWPTFHGAPNPEATSSHLQYFVEMLRYVTLYLPSHYVAISVLVTLLAFVGVWQIFTRDRKFASALFIPVLVLMAMYSSYVNIVVRNFLIYLPFVALAAGVGAAWLYGQRSKALRYAVLSLMLLAGIFNATLELRTGAQIRTNSVVNAVRASLQYVEANPTEHFTLSHSLRTEASQLGITIPKNVVLSPAKAQFEIFLFSDITQNKIPVLRYWPGILPNAITTFGAPEINVSYYPQWDMNFVVMLNSTQFKSDVANPVALGF